jgi:steroid 5-alpha reductase family enzyme
MNSLYLLNALLFSLGINIVLFLVAYKFKTDKLTDAAYALSFFVLTMFGLYSGELTSGRILVAAMAGLWAFRLGGFLLYRISVTGHDQRFDVWRNSFWLLGRFWVLQAVTAWVVLLPLLLALNKPDVNLTSLSVVGVALWAFALIVETIADAQKFRFTQNPKNKGKWIAEGLWSWSRHPNYFGEILVWVGIYMTVFSTLTAPERLAGLASPLSITGVLLFATGVPILEKQADKKWGKDKAYQEYKKRTSELLLLPPKR